MRKTLLPERHGEEVVVAVPVLLGLEEKTTLGRALGDFIRHHQKWSPIGGAIGEGIGRMN